jgi:hypothetical protein
MEKVKKIFAFGEIRGGAVSRVWTDTMEKILDKNFAEILDLSSFLTSELQF